MARLPRGVFSRTLSASLALALLLTFQISPSFAQPGSVPDTGATGDVGPLVWSASTVRAAGADRLQTSIAISSQGWERSDHVVIATARQFPDALAGGPLAYLYDAPLLTTEPDHLSDMIAEEIERLEATTAIILGGPAAVAESVEDDLRDAGIETIDRIGGSNRYETAEMVATRFAALSGGVEGVIVTTGHDFPDALSVSGFAGWYGTPILLTAPDRLHPATQRALDTLDPGSALIVGGPAAVTSGVESALPNPVRIGGRNRYDTARLIAEFAFSNGFSYENVFVATGKDFPDALAVSPLAARLKAPVVLTDPDALPVPTDEFFNGHCSSIKTVYILGGVKAVSAEVAALIDAATETRIAENVQVLPTSTMDAIDTITADGTIVLDASAPGVAEIEVSDVLVGGPSTATPKGFLVRVVAVNDVSAAAGGTVSIETTAAALDEVIEKGSIDVTGSVDPTFGAPADSTFDIASATAVGDNAVRVDFEPHDPAVSPAWSLGGQLNVPFEVSVGTDGELKNADWGAAATIEGNVFMRGDFVFNIAFGTVGYHWVQEWYWDWGLKSRWVQRPTSGITSLETKVYLSQSFALDLSVAGTIGKDIDVVELLEQKGVQVEVQLAQTWFWIGWVPVHLGLSAEPIIEAGINFGVEGTVGFRQTGAVTVGAAYDYRYGWRDLGSSSLSFEFKQPTLAGTAEASLSIGAKVNVTFYGLFGPYFGTQGTLGLSADTAEDPWWEAGLAIEGVYGGKFEIFSRTWEVGGTIPFADWAIAEAPGPFPTGGVIWWPASTQAVTASVGTFTPVAWDLGAQAAPVAMQTDAHADTVMTSAGEGKTAPAAASPVSLDPTTVDASDFAIEGLDVLSATVLASGDQVILTVSTMEPGNLYLVTCVAGSLFDVMKRPVMLSTADFAGFYRPKVVSAWADSDTAVVVGFDVGAGGLDPDTIQDSDFTIPGLSVSDASLGFGDSKVYLTTSAQSAGVSYEVQVADSAVLSAEGFPGAASSASFFGFYMPDIASAAAAGSTSVDVVFDAKGSELDPQFVDAADFTIAGLSVTGASLQPDGVTVRLTTSAQAEGAAYTVDVADAAVTSVEGYTCAAAGVSFVGYYEPAVVGATATDGNTVAVEFDAAGSALDGASITAADFTVAGLAVTGAVLQPDGVTVLLTTADHVPGGAYTVAVAAGAVTSAEGYPGAMSSASFIGYWPVTAEYAYDVDSTTVDVVFDSMDPLDAASVGAGDFTVRSKLAQTPLAVTGATVQPDGRTVRLTVATALAGLAYEVLVADGVLSDGTFVNPPAAVTFTGSSTFAEAAGNIPATDSLVAMGSLDSVTAYATGMQGFTYRTTNGGATWAKVANAQPGAVGNSYAIAFPDPAAPLTLVAPGFGGSISRSTNGATSWTRFYDAAVTTNHNSGCDFAGGTGRGYIVHGGGGLIESTDFGVSWHRHPTQDLTVKGVCVAFADDTHGYIGATGGRILVTSDSGATWTAKNTGLTGTFNFIAASPEDPLVAVAVNSDGSTARTEDGGQTWTVCPTGQTIALNEVAFADGNVVFAGGEQGLVLMSRDAGRTWTTIRWNAVAPGVGAMWVRDANSLWIGGVGGWNNRMNGS